MRYKLKDGLEVKILYSPRKIPVKMLQKFINGLIAEGAWILRTEKVTLEEEKGWKKAKLSDLRKNKAIFTIAVCRKEIAGMCEGRKEDGRERANVGIGISVSKKFRRKGLGEFLLKTTIERARKKFDPKNIFLSVAEPNNAARRLYAKVGFKKIARFPNWIEHRGKYYAKLWMVLK